jgi:hypothetical protein
MVFDILHKEKLYLSANKMQLFAKRLQVLGHIISDKGVSLDPHKVDSVLNWKVPTNASLVAGFVGAVGYLSNGLSKIRILLGVLSSLSEAKVFKWMHTHQRAFEEVKEIVAKHRHLEHRKIDYSPGCKPVNLVTDMCMSGAGVHVCQGDDLETAKMIAFWSAKFTTAQQNYSVPEQELLAIVEVLKRFRPILHGIHFRIYMDHEALQFIMTQKKLSGRQVHWLETLQEFDFEVIYLPGAKNVFLDMLSRIYSDELLGTVIVESEYVLEEPPDDLPVLIRISAISEVEELLEPIETGLGVLANMQLHLLAVLSKESDSEADDLANDKESSPQEEESVAGPSHQESRKTPIVAKVWTLLDVLCMLIRLQNAFLLQ